jgi:hypothetical protein
MSATLPALRRGYVLSHTEMGVFLGECLGLGFWSKLDPVGQDSAATFEFVAEAHNLIALHVERSTDLRSQDFAITEVAVDNGAWASMSEVVRVGLPAWNPLGDDVADSG